VQQPHNEQTYRDALPPLLHPPFGGRNTTRLMSFSLRDTRRIFRTLPPSGTAPSYLSRCTWLRASHYVTTRWPYVYCGFACWCPVARRASRCPRLSAANRPTPTVRPISLIGRPLVAQGRSEPPWMHHPRMAGLC